MFEESRGRRQCGVNVVTKVVCVMTEFTWWENAPYLKKRESYISESGNIEECNREVFESKDREKNMIAVLGA